MSLKILTKENVTALSKYKVNIDFLNKKTCDYFLERNLPNLTLIFDGAYAYSPKRFNAYVKFVKKNKPIPLEVQKIIDREKARVSYTPLLDMVFNSKYKSTSYLLYYPQTTIRKAKRMLCALKNEKKQVQINLIGYSWGGSAVMRLLKFSEKNGVFIKNVYTLDPIKRGTFFLGFQESINNNSKYFYKPKNVMNFKNIYQKTDIFSLPLIHLRGNEVLGADYNFNLSSKYPNASHVNLHTFEEVQNLLL